MADNKSSELVLESFLPYRLSYLTNIISRKLARLYSQQFDINPHEWRILAQLTRYPNISAAEVGEKIAMDKVAVSRAIKNLCDMGLVHKVFSPEDRRRSVLNLTEEGRNIYHKIEPLVIAYEESLLTILDKAELLQLDNLLSKLTAHVTTD